MAFWAFSTFKALHGIATSKFHYQTHSLVSQILMKQKMGSSCIGKESDREIKNTGFIAHDIKPNFYFFSANNTVEHEGKSMTAPGTENLKITASGEETNPQ